MYKRASNKGDGHTGKIGGAVFVVITRPTPGGENPTDVPKNRHNDTIRRF